MNVLVPSSLVREAEDKREATRKLGYVARAAAVFRADRLIVFPDREGERRWGGEFVRTVLAYAATPPYLRQEAWGRRDELEYAGVLPPLLVSPRTAAGSDEPTAKQGIVTEVGPEGRVRVNCGLQHPISLLVPSGMEVERGERVTVRISSREPVRARLVDEAPPGFAVEAADLSAALAREDAGVGVATSRHGRELSVSRLAELRSRLRAEEARSASGGRDRPGAGMTVAFGAPGRGLPAILDLSVEEVAASAAGDEGPVGPDPGFDLWLNAIPNQGSEVVRTEEAMFAALGCLTLTE